MGQWSRAEIESAFQRHQQVREYVQRCHALGTASDDAIAFAKNMKWELA